MKIVSTKKSSLPAIVKSIKNRQSKKADVESTVRDILKRVQRDGDTALFALTKKFDGASLQTLKVSKQEITDAYAQEDAKFIKTLRIAKANIEKFHKTTIRKKESAVITTKGVKVWREFRPIERVGLYIPGGKAAYPSSVLMLAVPATIAGCKEIVLCVPPGKDAKVSSAVLVAADICGISNIFKVGGAQAIAAMAYGTESIPKVSKIFGPGNAYVTAAKILVYGEVAIDMPAGPSEVLVVADETANPAWVAADLLSQLEHGEDSQAILVTFTEKFAKQVQREILRQTKELSRRAIVKESLANSAIVILQDLDQACALINDYAPEHLEIVSRKESEILKKVNNAGSVFLGSYSSEPLGDYATGANHTLPTSGYAKMFSPLSVESFGKMMQIQKVSASGIRNLRRTVEVLAEREGLDAHKNAVSIRFKKAL
ncbi:histidinol dehydrogenase [Candidatus Kaiserbacteria bacterium RIFCSPHIGHO2_01_FULL_53_29]|uniref:Histidinol dehydrogenase n=1 Tax=Candidatus Kaiserbacteria bacterium RIFCSPHIGHO2_01_FULL_53_29 TaxID=1798480 RepID=A0A1F6CW36_9BACT|nr:MAG: histidinol dehydrogenase [Candidatus Kaiserbacteria bacterium RIFCSPHIGHO2_01_FULL_53_29]